MKTNYDWYELVKRMKNFNCDYLKFEMQAQEEEIFYRE